MKALVVDPGSLVTGYAVMNGKSEILDAGKFLPNKTRDPNYLRIDTICDQFEQEIISIQPDYVVIEWTAGKINKSRHKGGGSGISIYGIAIGALWRTALHTHSDREKVIIIAENVWTKGIPKAKRMANIGLIYPQYNPDLDTGGDVADAIGLGRFFILNMKLEGGV